MSDAARPACPACDGPVRDVFDGGELPHDVGDFPLTREAALAAPCGRVLLAHCAACGLIHNRLFDPRARVYGADYAVALSHSPTFAAFVDALVGRLVERHGLRGKRIVEIGCGEGHVLRALARHGNHALGIDPTVRREGTEVVGEGSVTYVRDRFGPRHAHHEADFVCSLSVFEDIAAPAPFLAALHALAARRDAPVYLEVFNAGRAFAAGEAWSVLYEQCNYFSLAALQAVLCAYGFRITDAGTCYGGDQYIYVEARAGGERVAPDGVGCAGPRCDGAAVMERFARAHGEAREAWDRRLVGWRERGERAVMWGTGGKGVTFLNRVDARAIGHAVEINPRKQGRHVPGGGQLVVPPEALRDIRPDHVIVSNALYRDEMAAQARALGVEATFHVA